MSHDPQDDLPSNSEVGELVAYLNLEYGTPSGPDALTIEELRYCGKFRIVKHNAIGYYWAYPCNRPSGCWARIVYIDGYCSMDMTTEAPAGKRLDR